MKILKKKDANAEARGSWSCIINHSLIAYIVCVHLKEAKTNDAKNVINYAQLFVGKAMGFRLFVVNALMIKCLKDL